MVQKLPGGDKMTGFTRILHRTVPDILMEEVGSWGKDGGNRAGGRRARVERGRPPAVLSHSLTLSAALLRSPPLPHFSLTPTLSSRSQVPTFHVWDVLKPQVGEDQLRGGHGPALTYMGLPRHREVLSGANMDLWGPA